MTDISESIVESFNKHCDRGHYYRKNEDYDLAIQEFSMAIKKITSLAQIAANEGGYNVEEPLIKATHLLGQQYFAIAVCYREQRKYNKSIICANKIEEVCNAIENSGVLLNAEQLEEWKELRESANINKLWIKMQMPGISKTPKVDDSDEVFNKIKSYPISFLDLKNRSSSSNDSCFIATAAYSTSIHPDLDTFRKFRDQKLLTNTLGSLLVSFYYKVSPRLAKYISTKPAIKIFLRDQLQRLAKWMR